MPDITRDDVVTFKGDLETMRLSMRAELATEAAALVLAADDRDHLLGYRDGGLRPCASDLLRTRCAAHRTPPGIKGGLVTRRGWVPLSLAAGVLLAGASLVNSPA